MAERETIENLRLRGRVQELRTNLRFIKYLSIFRNLYKIASYCLDI